MANMVHRKIRKVAKLAVGVMLLVAILAVIAFILDYLYARYPDSMDTLKKLLALAVGLGILYYILALPRTRRRGFE